MVIRSSSDLRRAGNNTGCKPCSKLKQRSKSTPPKIAGARWIPLTRGKFALVDEKDYPVLSPFHWRALEDEHTWYAITGSNPAILMHRMIIGGKYPEVDHKDGNGLNNRRTNLRSSSREQNGRNRKKYGRKTSKYKGVCFLSGGWVASITFNKKTHYLGRFHDEKAAAKAYDSAAKREFGEFARTNF